MHLFHQYILWIIGILLVIVIVFAIYDYIIQRALFMRDMKMTKEEVKREYKEREGDPFIKGQRKQIARDMMDSKVVDLSKATVVISAGNELAVALYYDQKEAPLPLLVAKGSGDSAEDLIIRAKVHRVKVVSNASLARQLFDGLEIGGYLQEEMIEPVAQLLGRLGI